MQVDPHQLEKAIFLGRGVERFTQDSPILPDVWMEYGQRPGQQIDLLIDPYKDESPGKLGDVLITRLEEVPTAQRLRHLADPNLRMQGRETAFNQSTVVIRLYFDELICVVLPMTRWWNEYVWKDTGKEAWRFLTRIEDRQSMVQFMKRYPLERIGSATQDDMKTHEAPWFSSHLVWMVRVIGAIALAIKGGPKQATSRDAEKGFSIDGHEEEVVESAAELLSDYRRVKADDFVDIAPEPTGPRQSGDGRRGLDMDSCSLIWAVNLNRMAKTAMFVSTTAVKADAARLLFDVSCKHLCWAIIDSGVDARHPALQRRPPEPSPVREVLTRKTVNPEMGSLTEEGNVPADGAAGQATAQAPHWTETTRVIATYDFTLIRKLLNREKRWDMQLPPELRDYFRRNPRKKEDFENRLRQGRSIDWDYLLPYLAIPYVEAPAGASGGAGEADVNAGQPASGDISASLFNEPPDRREIPESSPERGGSSTPIPYYRSPKYSHGTHVAGILAADWRKDDPDNPLGVDLRGVCPDIRLYDLRVLGDDGTGDEFSLIAAMQFVRHLNMHKEMRVIHGVNLSLSIKHNVRNYACGCTPVCDESERLVNSGLVVVAAAGNDGYLHYLTRGGRDLEGYSSISITDPGNTEAVITVGSTHREKAHAYGVSFFSSRGPTGDGRAKPDLVAPGEKIVSLMPDEKYDVMDGTSMAAPHVSGAAALLMARYQELIGRPTRIKEILCNTATDLGRERYFQGRGMVDVLRAMQSI